ncbi:MAG TPA: Ig-like domain-containing protein [Thermoanaerobaculia bacterium]|nr:Ig-like domain-containing protein [Thermoanaerobaculia bacterium]
MLRTRGIAVVIAVAVLVFAVPVEAQKRHSVRFTHSGLAAVPDSYAGRKGDALIVDAARGVLANDLEPNRKPLIAMLITNVQHGSMTFNANGSFTYTHDGSEATVDLFTYKVSNGSAESLPATVKIVIGSSTAVTAAADTYSLGHNASITVAAPGLLVNDIGPANTTLSATAVTQPARGTLSLDANGGFTYAHDGSNSTTDSFTYRASTAGVSSAATTVTLRIAVDTPPTVVNQTYTATQNTTLTVAAPGVLTNAYDPDSKNLTASLVTNPSHGSVTLNADGSFAYTPAIGYFGSDSFTYRGSDGIFSSLNVSTASINVSGAPTANADSYSASASTALSIGGPGVLANDVTGGGAITSYGALTGLEQPVLGSQTSTSRGGLVTLLASGGFTYSPPANATSTDSFAYVIGNSAGSSLATVTLNLYTTPSASSDAYDVATGITRVVAAPGILDNDVTNGATIASNTKPLRGTLTLGSDGSFTYVPNAGYVGIDSFSYTISNFSGNASGVVTLRVLASPVAVADAYANSSSTLTIPAPGVLANDTTSLATIASYGVNGTEQTGIGSAAATAKGGSIVISASGAIAYTPPPNFSGADTFRYTLANYAGSTNAVVTITSYVTPTAAADSYFCPRNTPTVISATSGILANDTISGAKLVSFGATGVEQATFGQASSTLAGGSITLAADGSFTYVPPMLYVGSDSFRYVLSNAAGSVVGVVALNVLAAPVAANDTYQASVNATLSVPHFSGITANDTLHFATIKSYGATGAEQTNIGQLTATTQKGTLSINADGSFSYTPATSFSGSDSFAYVLSSTAGTSMANVTITVSNTPIAMADSFQVAINTTRTIGAPGVLTNDTLAGGNIAGFGAAMGTEQTSIGNPTGTAFGGSIALGGDGSFTYTPPPAFSGTDRFLYRLQNGSGHATATVSLQVFPTPVVAADNYATPKNTRLIIGAAGPTVLANDGVNGASILSFGATGSEQSSPGQNTTTAQGGVVALNPDGTFTYTPANNFAGTDTFRYTLSNYSGAAVGTVTITVAAGPVAAADNYTGSRGTTLNVNAASGLLANDTLNGSTLFSYGANGVEQQTVGQTTPTAQGGTVKVSADGSFTYSPASQFTGTDTFRYVLFSAGGAAFGNVTISIAAAPVAANDTHATPYNVTLVVPAPGVFANDQRNAGTLTSYGKTGAEQTSIGSSTATTRGGTVSLGGDGSFSYTPANDFTGTDTFAYVVTNTSGNSMATVTIAVLTGTPVAVADFVSTPLDTTLTIAAPGIVANDTANGGTISGYGKSSGSEQTSIGAPTLTTAGGTVLVTANGAVTYMPKNGYSGTDTFVYMLTNSVGSAKATVTILVAEGAPVAVPDSYTTTNAATLSIAAPGVLANDTLNGGSLAGTGSATPTANGGTVTLSADGSFAYNAAAGFSGNDTFVYTLTNVAGSSTATVTISVTNGAPVAVADQFATTLNTSLTIALPGVFTNDTRNGATVASYGKTGSEQTAPGLPTATTAGGTVSLLATGGFTYLPKSGYSGVDTFVYKLTNAAGTSQATVTIVVGNGAPIASADAHATALNATLVTAAPGVLANDVANGAFLASYGAQGTEQTSAGAPAATLHLGTVALSSDGSFTYAPAANFSGTDSFVYRLTNVAGSSSAVVTIVVANGVPVARADSYLVASNTALPIAAPGILGNDTANGASVISYGQTTGAEQTVLGVATATSAGGTVQVLATGGFTYFPKGGYSGTDSFVYTLGNSAGTTKTTVTIVVGNGTPVAVVDSYSTPLSTALTTAAPGVLANDIANGASIAGYGKSSGNEQTVIGAPTATAITGGTIALNSDGSFTYTPPSSFSGTDSFVYKLTNVSGSATATVTIVVANGVPVARNDSFATALNTPLNGALLPNDTANGGAVVGYGKTTGTEQSVPGVATPTSAGGSVSITALGAFTYLPKGGYSGTDSFVYTLGNNSGTSSATVTIVVGNGAPIAVADAYPTALATPLTTLAPGVLGNDTTNGASIVSYGRTAGNEQTVLGAPTATFAPGGAVALSADGSFVYTPPSGFSGTDSFVYKLTNVSGSTTATVTITVANGVPVAHADNYLADRSAPVTIDPNGVLANDTLNGATILSYGASTGTEQTAIGAVTATSAGGSVALHAHGGFTYLPKNGFSGVDTFVYTLINSAGTSKATVTITVGGTLPVVLEDRYTTGIGVALNVAAPGILGNDTVNGATIASYGNGRGSDQSTLGMAVATERDGMVTLQANGSFQYQPPPLRPGETAIADSFGYVLRNAAGSVPGMVMIGVVPAPMASNDTYNTSAGASFSGSAPGLLTNDKAIDAVITSYGKATGTEQTSVGSATTTAKGGFVTVRGDGSFTYSPAIGFSGIDSFSYVLTGAGGTSVANVSIGVWLTPVAIADTYATTVGVGVMTTAANGVLANDVENGATLSLDAAHSAEYGTLTFNTIEGSFVYTPHPDFVGVEKFGYVLSNPAATSSAIVTITVSGPPIARPDEYDILAGTMRAESEEAGLFHNDAVRGGTVYSYGATTADADQRVVGTQLVTALGGTVTISTHGGFAYLPPAGVSTGTDTLVYRLKNETGISDFATIIFYIRDVPAPQPDHYAVANRFEQLAPGILRNDLLNGGTLESYGANGGEQLSIGSVTPTQQGGRIHVQSNGSFVYVPPADKIIKTDSFKYVLANSTGTATATVTFSLSHLYVVTSASQYTRWQTEHTGSESTQGMWSPLAPAGTGVMNVPRAVTFRDTLYTFHLTGGYGYKYSIDGSTWQTSPTAAGPVWDSWYAASPVVFNNQLRLVHVGRAYGIETECDWWVWCTDYEVLTHTDLRYTYTTNGSIWSGIFWMNTNGISPHDAPSSVVFSGQLYTFYQGANINRRGRTTTGTGNLHVSTSASTTTIPNVRMVGAPAAVVHGGELIVFYIDQSSKLNYVKSTNGTGWRTPVTLSAVTSAYDSLSPVSFGDDLYLVYRDGTGRISYVNVFRNALLTGLPFSAAAPTAAVFP